MKNKLDKENLLDQIASNEVGKTLNDLRLFVKSEGLLKSELGKKLTFIERKFKDLKFKSISNLIDKQTEFLQGNQITWDLLNFIQEFPSSQVSNINTKKIIPLFEVPKLHIRIISSLIDLVFWGIIYGLVILAFESIDYRSIRVAIVVSFFCVLIKDLLFGKSIGKRITKLSVEQIKGRNKNKELYLEAV